MIYASRGRGGWHSRLCGPSMRLVLIPTDTVTEEGLHGLEGGVEALIEGDSCTVVEDGESMTAIAPEGSCFELHVGTETTHRTQSTPQECQDLRSSHNTCQ